ncbi:4bb59674-6a75-4b5c-b1a2-25db1f5c63f6-CDS [Sclerotinia trifoliorum]|uniref:4bb59674-6a75-4b5c-b1a2-25db1f5c63f6-CDS n=1 Tax=Sclerotinia trifoliorum TaxID=28548 RepID=A0A8H2ZK63_9HELO|nr:4bb59674-6a75-4b5c-b1a2-25db1f5c63f6-CDS [Sclerotinia trifoliorum]
MPRHKNAPRPEPTPPNHKLAKGIHHPWVPGITAQIISKSREAFPNHDAREKEPMIAGNEDSEYYRLHTITKYIAVTNNASFSIHLKVDRPYPKTMDCSRLQFEIFVDGEFVWNEWCSRPDYQRHGKGVWESTVDGMKVGKGRSCEVSGFRFSAIKTNDERLNSTVLQRIKASMSKIGKIEIRVYKTKYGKLGGDVMNNKKAFRNKHNINVPEKALKGAEAKSHGTALGEARKTSRGTVLSNAQKHDERPMVVFVFLYRSEEALKAMHIIERTPTPSRSSSPEIIDHGSSDSTATHASLARQMAEIEQMRRELAEQMASLQRSSTNSVGRGDQSSSRKRIKREEDDKPGGSQKLVKRRRAEKGKGKITVDLTGDSEDEGAKSPRVSSDDEGLRSNELVEDDDDYDDDDNLFVRDNRA